MLAGTTEKNLRANSMAKLETSVPVQAPLATPIRFRISAPLPAIRLRSRLLCCSALLAGLMVGAAPAAAQSTTWTGGAGDSLWSTAGNWSNGVPTTGVVTTIGSGSPSVILNGGLTASSGVSRVGNGSTLTISGGASLTSARWDVGQFSDGNMVVTGTGTELIVNAEGLVRLLVGTASTGALTITDGAVVNTGNESVASVVILGDSSGTGSILLNAVGSNRGVLEVLGISRQAGSLTFDGGILRATGGNNNFLSTFSSGSVVINAGGAFIDSNGFDIGISAPLTGPGGLTKLGSGTLSLTTANSYAGVTTISAGYLNVSDNAALGTTAAGTVVLPGGALQLQNNVTISGEALTLNGTGPTGLGALRSISDTNTYAGNITLGSDALITHSSGLGSLTVSGSVSGNSGLTVGGIGTIFVSGNITTGTGGLTKEGNGTLVLSGTGNTFTGATTINAGTLQAGAADVIASSSALVLADASVAIFSTNGYDQSVRNLSGGGSTGGTVIATTGTTLTIIQDGGGSTFAGIIGGGGNLAKDGADVLILSGTNGYSGTTSINGGELRLGSTGALSGTSMVTLANTAGAFLSLNGFSATINGLQGGGSTGGNVDLGTGTLTVNQSTNTTYSGAITGAGSVVKAGTGTLTLTGISDFTGGLTVTAGGVNFNSAGALGASGGSVLLNGGGLQWATGTSTDISGRLSLGASGGTLDTNGNDVTLGTAFGGLGALTKRGTGTLTLSAATTYAGATIISEGTLALSGNGSIASSASLLVDGTFDISGITGPGTFVTNLSGDATTGVVALGAKTLTVTQQTEFLQLAGGLSGTGTLIKQGTEALTLSGDSSAFSGTVQVNAGTLSITDWGGLTAATVGGNVSVASGGTLEAAGATIDGTVTIASGGILEWTRNGSNIGNIAMGALSMDAGAVTRINLNSPSGASSIISVTGDAAVNGTLNLVSTPAYGAGVYRVITTGGTLTDNGMVLGETQPDYTFRIDTQPQSLDVVVTALDTTVQYWSADGTTRGGGGNWTSGNNWLGAGGGYAVWAGDTAVFDGPFGIVMVDGTQSFNTIEFLTSGYTLQAGVSGQLNLGAGGRLWAEGDDIIVTVAAPIIGTGALTKIGEGTIVLSGINTYQGGTIIQAGTLEISSDANLGDAAGSITFAGGELEATTTLTSARNVVLNAQATISVEEASTLTLTGTLSGTAGLVFGGGKLVLSGTNTYQGATIIGSGTLSLTGTGSIAGSSGVEANGVFDISGTMSGASIVSLSGTGSVALGAQTLSITNGAGAFSGTIGGSGGLTVSGGTQALSGVNGFTGETRIEGGTLALTGTGSIEFSSGVVADGTFDISGVSGGGTSVQTLSGTGSVVLGANVLTLTAAAGDFQGGISGTGGLTLAGGTQTLSGTNTYSGTTTVAAGTTLVAASSGAMSGGPVALEGTLQLDAPSATIGGLSGGGTVLAPGGSISLTIAPASGTTSVFSGMLTSAPSATLGLVVNGPGTQVLASDLIYGGGTTILQGTLQLGNGGASGSIQGYVVNNGTLAFNRTGTVTFEGDISGTGALTQMGPGTLVLTGENSYTGNTTIAAGTLQVGDGGTQGSLQGNVVNNGALVFNRSGTVTFAGDISGTGALTQMGPGTLVLTGENSYTGNTTIPAGTLQVGDGGTRGSLQGNVVNNGALVFNRSGTVTFAGDISGTGALTQMGPGTLVLTGTSSYSGGTSVRTGTLVLGTSTAAGTGAIAMSDGTTLGLAEGVSVANDLTLGGAVTFDLASGSATLSGVLSGTGAIAFSGGRISLTGDSSAFTGATVVNGTLAVNGLLGGSVTVVNGGTLKGSGTVGSTTVAAGGTVAPGNSIGTLTVNGTLAFASGSTYAVEIDNTGASDLILVTGTATLGGATVAVTKAAGAYLPGTHYTILTAQGGITGTFSGSTQDMPFVDLALSYDAQNAYLDVARNATPFPSVAVTANQRATAGAVEALGESNAVYDAVVSQTSVAGAQQAFNALDGEIYPSALSALQQESLILRRAVLDRARVPSGSASTPLAYASGSAAGADVVGMAGSPSAFWAQAFGDWSRIGGNGNAATVSGDTAGVIVGYDRTFMGNGADWRLGFAAGYSSSDYQVNARSSSLSSDNAHVALYGGTRMGALGVRLGGAYSWADISANRTVAFPGVLNALDTDTFARTGQVFGEVGYDLSFAKVQVEPFAGLAYVNVDMNGFTELGGPSALTAAGSSAGVTYSTLGARLSAPFSLGDLPAAFNGTLAWQHAFDDTSPNTRFAFGTGGLPFSISGVPIASDAALVEAGLDLNVAPNAALSVFYAGQISQDDTSNMVKGRFTLKF